MTLSRDEIEQGVAFKYGMFIQKNVQGRVNLVICRVVVELTFQKQRDIITRGMAFTMMAYSDSV